jgi:nitroimidazol reductase NimA-like FMN-containing flavoprotein (pyridoxamine 5'-phosphate oxidase superfamily)
MRRREREIQDEKEIRDILERGSYAALVSVTVSSPTLSR